MRGRIPAALSGVYYRNGPGRFQVGDEYIAHPFDGDGMVMRVHLSPVREEPGGRRIEVTSRYIRTEGYVAETEAGRILFRNTFGTQRAGGALANCFDLSQKNIANTGLMYWGRGENAKLLALWEASQPYELHPVSLETLGLSDVGGLLRKGMPFATGLGALDSFLNGNADLAGDPLTAHPHVERNAAESDRLVSFGYQVSPDVGRRTLRTTFSFYEWDEDFRLLSRERYPVEGFAFVHDFCFTENYYIFFQNPVSIDMLPFVLGARCPGECLEFDAGERTKVHVVPRPGRAAHGRGARVFTVDPCFVFHHVNAYEDGGGGIVVDSVRLPEIVDFAAIGGVGGGAGGDAPEGPAFLNVDFDAVPVNQLYRFRMDLRTGVADDAVEVSPRCCEFPTVNPANFSRRHRFAYCGGSSHPRRNQPLQAWIKYDLDTMEEVGKYFPGPTSFAGEPEFVSREEPASEDDGWLVGLFFNGETDLSELHIVDAITLEEVAVVMLRHHMPYGLHGTWVSSSELGAA